MSMVAAPDVPACCQAQLLDVCHPDNVCAPCSLVQCLDLDDELNTHSNWHVEAGPSATTQKVLLGMQWAVRRFDFDYFMKLGDDSYFRQANTEEEKRGVCHRMLCSCIIHVAAPGKEEKRDVCCRVLRA